VGPNNYTYTADIDPGNYDYNITATGYDPMTGNVELDSNKSVAISPALSLWNRFENMKNGTVLDNLTGLTMLDTVTTGINWNNAMALAVTLSNENYGGFNDWKLMYSLDPAVSDETNSEFNYVWKDNLSGTWTSTQAGSLPFVTNLSTTRNQKIWSRTSGSG